MGSSPNIQAIDVIGVLMCSVVGDVMGQQCRVDVNSWYQPRAPLIARKLPDGRLDFLVSISKNSFKHLSDIVNPVGTRNSSKEIEIKEPWEHTL